MPEWIEPSLCTLVTAPPAGGDWLHEIKLDGYRILARVEDGQARLLSRNGKDWTGQFASIARAVAALPFERAILDGEVVILKADGTTSFQELQNALSRQGQSGITYFAFDLLHFGDHDLTAAPLRERKRLLQAALAPSDTAGVIRYTDHVQGSGVEFYRQACAHGLEGTIAKRAESPYRSGRSRDWLKMKCLQGQEFVIGGYTEGTGSRTGFGALLLGVNEEAGLRYAGRVGTGFTETSLRELSERLRALERRQCPFSKRPTDIRAGVHWVEPELVAEVVFLGWTRDGLLRQPSFRGLRSDKRAADIVREQPLAAPPPAQVRSDARVATRVAGIRITNPAKVLYPDPGVTKYELAQYYDMVAEWMVPHVSHRPLTLVRCPDGYEGECFFQKNVAEGTPPQVGRVHIPDLKEIEDSTYQYVKDAAGLVALLQLGVLEFHIWGSRQQHLEQPDRVTFDLDPGPGVSYEEVIEGALLVRDTLARLQLRSRVMLTGGKGLHVVLPLEPEHDWATVKDFSHAFVQALVRSHPTRYTAHLAKVRRERKIFLDYLRNGRGATAVAPYSTRARAGAPVAVPIDWDELRPSLLPNAFNVRNLARRMQRVADPWLQQEIAPQWLGKTLSDARAALGPHKRKSTR